MAIPTRIHGMIHHAAGAALAVAPRAMGWHGTTRRLMDAAAAGSTAYALATDYEWGVAPLLSMEQHLALDAAQGVGFLAAAALLSEEPREARFAMAGYGLFALTVVALSNRRSPDRHSPNRRHELQRLDLQRRELAARRVLEPPVVTQ